MNKNLAFDFDVNKESHTITIKREFAAELLLVWDAYTKPELMDQWWAPKPWKCRTKTQDFREGGHWHYAMVGPEGEEHWCWNNYITIQPQQRYTGTDGFADANGTVNTDMPQSEWDVKFQDKGEKTQVNYHIKFGDLAQLETTIQMGFKEGFTMTLNELEKLLTTAKK